MPISADDAATHGEQGLPANDDFGLADLDLDDGWDPMQRYASSSPMLHTTHMLPAGCTIQPQHDHSAFTPASARHTTNALPGSCNALPQSYHSIPAAERTEPAEPHGADVGELQSLTEFPDVEAQWVFARGAAEAQGTRGWS